MIELTVGIPMYRAGQIAWLPLEGLCAQEDVDFAWELLVVEEPERAFGPNRLAEYRSRLEAVGCVRVCYEPIPEWVPLPQKWAEMGRLASPTSRCFLLQGADDYPQPRRLRAARDAFRADDLDWVSDRRGLFYDIPTGMKGIYEGAAGEPTHGISIAIRSALMRDLPHSEKTYGVDNWLFKTISAATDGALHVVRLEDDAWRQGLYTDGQNQITHKRSAMIKGGLRPFTSTNMAPSVSADALGRLVWLGGRAKQRMHTEWWPPEGYGRFPLDYIQSFLRRLLADERVEFTTYDDLAPKADKIRVVLNHDVDASPERTLVVLEFEAALGIVSCVALFRECVDNAHLQETREVRFMPYDVPWARLRELHELGFRFGYHCNAYERADFNFEAAHRLAGEDIAFLKERVPLSYYSAHGGLRGPKGEASHLMKPDPAWGLMPAHNCIGKPRLPSYSDTNLVRGKLTPFAFADRMRPGAVYRILLHPQYYHTPCKPFDPCKKA